MKRVIAFASSLTLVTSLLAPASAFADEPSPASSGAAAPTSTTTTTSATSAPEPAAPQAAPAAAFAPTPAAPARETTILGLPKNVGPADRVIRGVIAASLIGIGSYGLASKNIDSTLSGVLLGVAVIPTATAVTGYCPLYQVVGVDYTF